jgi:hypothetical protein
VVRGYDVSRQVGDPRLRLFVSLDLGATKSKSCLIGQMRRYDDSEGEEQRSGGEVKREVEAWRVMASDGKETTRKSRRSSASRGRDLRSESPPYS